MKNPNFNRLLTVLWREGEPDKIPFFEVYVDKEVVEAYTGEILRPMRISYRNEIDLHLKYIVKFYQKLGYDYIPLRISPDFPRNNSLFTDDGANIPRNQREWLDENRGIIKNRKDLDEYPWPEPEDLVNLHLFYIKILRKYLPRGMKVIPYTSGIFENVTRLLGIKPFIYKIYQEPSLIRDIFQKVGYLISFYIKAVSEEDEVGAITYNDDMGYNKGPIMSPRFFKLYVFPWQKRCVNFVHKNDKPFILHSCGNLKILMDDLINYVHIDAKHSFQDIFYPVTEFKRLYGKRIAILGGVDIDNLARMPLLEFRKYIKNIINECAVGGGYSLGSGNTITNYVKLENYLTMLKIGNKYGKYPILP